MGPVSSQSGSMFRIKLMPLAHVLVILKMYSIKCKMNYQCIHQAVGNKKGIFFLWYFPFFFDILKRLAPRTRPMFRFAKRLPHAIKSYTLLIVISSFTFSIYRSAHAPGNSVQGQNHLHNAHIPWRYVRCVSEELYEGVMNLYVDSTFKCVL